MRARLEAARRQGLMPLLLLLERLDPGATDVGGETAAQDELLRLRHDPSLRFATGDVAWIEERTLAPEADDLPDDRRQRWTIATTFLGLTGTVSPLPQYVAEEVAQEQREDPAGQDFLDLFHHRALSLLVRGLLDQDPAAIHRSDATDLWSRRLLALLGFDPGVEGAPASSPDEAADAGWRPLRAAPLLSQRALTGAGLAAILRDALAEELAGATLAIEQFEGIWVPVPAPDRTRLGVAASRLGLDMVVGQTVLDRSSAVAVVIGPVGRAGYQRFAIERAAAERLRSVVGTASRGDIQATIELLLAPDAAPPLCLTGQGGARLGRDAWLGGQRKPARLRVDPTRPDAGATAA